MEDRRVTINLQRYYRTQKRGKMTLTYVGWADLCHAVNEARWVWHWDIELLTVPGQTPAVKGVLTVRGADNQTEVKRCAIAPVDFESPGGNPWEDAESAAFRRAWAKFGVGLELWRGVKNGTLE